MRRMSEGDLVLTPMQGACTSARSPRPAYFEESASVAPTFAATSGGSTRQNPIDGSELRAPVPALLQSQAYVVDLTEAYDQLAALIPRSDEEKPPPVRPPKSRSGR